MVRLGQESRSYTLTGVTDSIGNGIDRPHNGVKHEEDGESDQNVGHQGHKDTAYEQRSDRGITENRHQQTDHEVEGVTWQYLNSTSQVHKWTLALHQISEMNVIEA